MEPTVKRKQLMATALRLSPADEAAIADTEWKSFLSFCRQTGNEPNQYLRLVLKTRKKVTARAIESLRGGSKEFARSDPRRAGLAELLRHYRSCLVEPDPWTLITKVDRYDSQMQDLLAHIDSRFVDEAYVYALGARLGLPAAERTVVAVANGVPRMALWVNDFNAFVSGRSSVGNLPCVVLYQIVHAGLSAVAEAIADAVTELREADGAIGLRHEEDFARVISDPEFIADCRTALRFCLGRTSGHVRTRLDFSTRGDVYWGIHNALTTGAEHLVVLHEYGHLLRGHLGRGPSHAVEFEADEFAAHTMATRPLDQVGHLYVMGGAMALAVLCVIDSGMKPSKTHPRSFDRLMAYLKICQEHGAPIYVAAERILRTIQAAVNEDFSFPD